MKRWVSHGRGRGTSNEFTKVKFPPSEGRDGVPVKNLRVREPVVAGVQGYGVLTVHIAVLCIFYVCSLA